MYHNKTKAGIVTYLSMIGIHQHSVLPMISKISFLPVLPYCSPHADDDNLHRRGDEFSHRRDGPDDVSINASSKSGC